MSVVLETPRPFCIRGGNLPKGAPRRYARLKSGMWIPTIGYDNEVGDFLPWPPSGGAPVKTADMEEGDLSDFDGFLVEASNAVTAEAGAKQLGTYGMQVVTVATNDDAHHDLDLGAGATLTQLWVGCWFHVASDLASGNNGGLIACSDSTLGSGGTHWGWRSQAGYTNRMAVWDGGAWDQDDGTRGTYDMPSTTWLRMDMRVKVESIGTANDGEVDLWIDTDNPPTTLRFSRTDLNNGANAIRYVRVGGDFSAVAATTYFDHIVVDNAARPTIASPGGGAVTSPYYIMAQG